MRPWTKLRTRPLAWWILQSTAGVHGALAITLWREGERALAVGCALVGLSWALYSDWRWAWPDVPPQPKDTRGGGT